MIRSANSLRRTPPTENVSSNMVPLINVVFLMLIFFLLVGTIRATDPVAPIAPESTHNQPRDTKSVLVIVDRDGAVWLDGATIETDALSARLAALFTKPLQTRELTQKAVEVRVDKRTTFSVLNKVLTQINLAGANQTTLVTRVR